MQPAADVDPASVSIIVQSLSRSMSLNIVVPFESSRELNDILSIASINSVESKF